MLEPDGGEGTVPVSDGSLQRGVKLRETSRNLRVHLTLTREILGKRIPVRTESFANLENLRASSLAGEEHHVHRLLNLLPRARILHFTLDGRLLKEHVTASGAK